MVEKVMMVLEVEWLMMMLEVEWWSKHSPSLGSSHMGGKQTREWRSWNPESVFTTSSSSLQHPVLWLGKGRVSIIFRLRRGSLGSCDLPG